MPGNRVIYQQAVRKAHSAAWDKKWLKAIDEYRRALQEFPDDFEARLSIAHALAEAGQLESALAESQKAVQLHPQEEAAIARQATLEAKLGRNEDAVASYLRLAEIHLSKRSRGGAVEAWHRAAALAPDRVDVHEHLAEVYEKGAHQSLAAKEHLALAKIYHKAGDKVRASQSAQRALELDPRNTAINDWMQSAFTANSASEPSPANPVNQAQQEAIARLADTLLEDQPAAPKVETSQPAPEISLTKPEIDALIARAIDAQTHRRVADAIAAYRKLLSGGVARPEVKFNLGLLYSETMRYDEAIRLLRETALDPTYALASHYELGKCYRVLGNLDKALEHFLAVTKIVDLGSIQREHADELIAVYQELANSYAVKGERKKADEFNTTLQEFLSSKGWADKVDEVKIQIETVQEEDRFGMAEPDSPDASKVIKSLSLSQEYLRRGKTRAAGEECLRAIELAPFYLPAHVRLAEILAREGRMVEAKDKYQTIAELCLARGDMARAEGFYRQMLKFAPDDVMGRSRLIDISLQQGRVDDVLQQYLELGDEYFQKGEFGKAAEKFSEGIRAGAKSSTPLHLTSTLQHRYAEALVKATDYRRALTVYQEIKQQYPDDERARLMTIDLKLRLGQIAPALQELDALATLYQSRGQTRQLVSLLEELVQNYPDESDLHERLAQHLVTAGDTPRAIEVLDSLGELQLSKGQRRAAAATIRKIITLNPSNVDDYKLLLQQIGETALS